MNGYYSIRVDVRPQPQARPRIFSVGLKTFARSPKTSYYEAVFWAARAQRPRTPIDGPVILLCEHIHPRPKNIPVGRTLKATLPDWDNEGKAVSDALKKAGWFTDDGRVAVAAVVKRYAAPGEKVGAIIMAREIVDEARAAGTIIALRDLVRE